MARKLTDKDLQGKKFGRWTILDISHREKRQIYVKVKCDCGTVSIVPYHANLRSGKSKSCGCLSGEKASKRMTDKKVEKLQKSRDKYIVDGIGTKQLKVEKWKHNTSGYKGVSYMKSKEKWRAYIGLKGKHIHLGLFDSKEEAKEAREKAEKELKDSLD